MALCVNWGAGGQEAVNYAKAKTVFLFKELAHSNRDFFKT